MCVSAKIMESGSKDHYLFDPETEDRVADYYPFSAEFNQFFSYERIFQTWYVGRRSINDIACLSPMNEFL